MRHGRAKGEQIARVRSVRVSATLREPMGAAQYRFEKRESLLVQVVTASGAEGWGECFGPLAVVDAAVIDFFAPLLLGQDVGQPDLLWQRLHQAALPYGRRGALIGALSGIDMAVWDLRGHLQKRPMCDLLGGRMRDSIPCYATALFFRERPESELIPLLVEEATHAVESGFRGVKAQLGRNLTYDTHVLRALRKALPHTLLMGDAYHAYDMQEALQIARVAEEVNLWFLEDPLSLEFPDQYRQLAERCQVPLVTGEWEQTRWGYQSLLAHGGLAQVQVNLGWCGGVSEGARIRTLASTHGVNILPVCYETALNQAAALHFLASDFRLPGRLEAAPGMLSVPAFPNPLRDRLFGGGIVRDGGLMQVPTAPGLGVTVDPDALASFSDGERVVGS